MARPRVILRKRNSEQELGTDKKEIRHLMRLAKVDANKLVTRADKLAQDFIKIKNFPVKELEPLYLRKPWEWKVDFYYPNAVGGPLLVDEPQTIDKHIQCQLKADFLKAKGFRYVALHPLHSEMQDKLELEKCGQVQTKQ